WTVALWHARESDPLQTVVINAGPRGRNDRIRIRIPADAMASPPPYREGESDSHMSVVSPDRKVIHEFIGAHKVGERTWGAGCYVPMPIDGSGIGHMTGFEISDFRIEGMLGFGSTRAYGGSSTAGLIVSGELEPGIEHMLACPAHIDVLTSPWGWRAARDDWFTNYPFHDTGAKVALGMIFAIPPDVDLKAMKLGHREYHVLRAMQTHGLMVVDRGGRNWSIYMDYNARHEARGFDVDAIRKVMSRHLTRITNIAPDTPQGRDYAGLPPSGVGRRPHAPFTEERTAHASTHSRPRPPRGGCHRRGTVDREPGTRGRGTRQAAIARRFGRRVARGAERRDECRHARRATERRAGERQ